MRRKFTCLECSGNGCNSGKEDCFPKFCPTKGAADEEIRGIAEIYSGDGIDAVLTKTAIEIDSEFYCEYTRVEETIAFAHRIGAKRVGLAFCIGLLKEAKVFADIARKNGLEIIGAVCKMGSIDKCEIGFDDSIKHNPGTHEPVCNPIMQAKFLNGEKTDLNILIGLCVGHDSIFYRYSDAPVTTLIVKDRITGHDSAAPLYNADSFYKGKFSNIKIYKEDK